MNHIKYRIFGISVLFLVLIFFPKINTYLKLISDTQNYEKRIMADKPPLNIKNLKDYPQRYESFFNDRFCIRSRVINSFVNLNVKCFNKSPFPEKLIIGYNKWLYMAGNEIDAYSGKNSLRDGELDTLKRELEFRNAYCKKRNINFYFFIAPEKAVIHPENLPYNFSYKNSDNWGKQLLNYLKEKSNVKTIECYDDLISKKNKNNLYYHNDNHWNHTGAFFANNVICKEINKDFGDIKPLDETGVIYSDTVKADGNLSDMIGNIIEFKNDTNKFPRPLGGFKSTYQSITKYKAPEGFLYSWAYEVRKTKPNAKHKILIICDSFGENLLPYISESFNTTVKIWDAWSYRLNEDIIEQEQPDIVLLEVHEPLIRNILQNLSFPKK